MRFTCRTFLAVVCTAWVCSMAVGESSRGGLDYRHPRPAGMTEDGAAAGPQKIDFTSVEVTAGITHDLAVQFPKNLVPEFEVARVLVNGIDRPGFGVVNKGVINGNRRVHGKEDFTVWAYAGWEPGKTYEVVVEGQDGSGKPVRVAQAAVAPAEREAVKSLSFATPTAHDPYHHAVLVLAKEAIEPGTVTRVEVDGVRNRDARFFNEGPRDPQATGESLEGETYTKQVDGSRDFRVLVPVDWTNGSQHTVSVTLAPTNGEPRTFSKRAKAPDKGGYWSVEWPHSHSLVVTESAGVRRDGEPVTVAIALFADEIGDPKSDLRVVTYDPTHPKAGPDGYVVAPHQLLEVSTWDEPTILGMEEKDAETGEMVHRFHPTTTVELVFLADVQAYESRVYQVVYGNKNATPPQTESSLRVQQGEGLAQTIENGLYRCVTTPGSGAVDTFEILGGESPILLEHHVETNGAIHWNPEFYSPPSPWVHASDWGTVAIDVKTGEHRQYPSPNFKQYSGPVLHRTERYAPLPEQEHALVSITYEFYPNQPYIMMSSYEEISGDHFVQALRNNELVFNKEVFNEFVWLDPQGIVQSLDLETSRKHPVHAVEIPAETPWMAFINRDKKVGFASLNLAFEVGNRYAKLPSEAQPYIYVQNGPWYYFSRPIVYPFGGKNQTRMMPVRDGSFYYEKAAWLPFRFPEGGNPFSEIESLQKKLSKPLEVVEWQRTNARTPEKWVMPILTQPFDEGVEGAVSAQKEVGEKQ